MKVQCSHCNTHYQLDDNKIPNKKIKFKCRNCQNPVYVNKDGHIPRKTSSRKEMVCPKCGQRQVASAECIHCGMILDQDTRVTKDHQNLQVKTKLKKENQAHENEAPAEEIVDCPKCSHGLLPEDSECPKCGIVIEKYKTYLAKKKQVESEASLPVEGDAVSVPPRPEAEEEIDKQEKTITDPMVCKACLKEIAIDANFCPHCGEPAKT